MRPIRLATVSALTLVAACNATGEGMEAGNANASTAAPSSGGRPFTVEEVGRFDEPWAMTFLPGGRRR